MSRSSAATAICGGEADQRRVRLRDEGGSPDVRPPQQRQHYPVPEPADGTRAVRRGARWMRRRNRTDGGAERAPTISPPEGRSTGSAAGRSSRAGLPFASRGRSPNASGSQEWRWRSPRGRSASSAASTPGRSHSRGVTPTSRFAPADAGFRAASRRRAGSSTTGPRFRSASIAA